VSAKNLVTFTGQILCRENGRITWSTMAGFGEQSKPIAHEIQKGSIAMKLRNKILLGVMTAVTLGLWQGTTSAAAYSTNPSDVMQTAPQGLKIDGKGYFEVPAILGADNVTNMAKILPDSGRSSLAPMDGVELSSYGVHDTGGAVWSHDKSFDMYQNQRASMWIYVSGVTGEQVGDGMAFVLQNDMRNNEGNRAFSGAGESLGVWGVDPKSSTNNAIAGTAIQNSWALEFDTRLNQTVPTSGWNIKDAVPSDFDNGKGVGYSGTDGATPSEEITSQHLASGYPAQNNTYTGIGQTATFPGLSLLPRTGYYYTQKHLGLIRDSAGDDIISDAAWHHVVIDYKAPAAGSTDGQMTYTYDDEDPKTGGPDRDVESVTEDIDLNNLNVSENDPDVYWGFTGSTGDTPDGDLAGGGTETSLVVFEQVPTQVEAKSDVTMTDMTQNKPITTGSSFVKGNDRVQLKYNLSDQSNNRDWKDVNAKLKVPAGVTISGGNYQTDDSGAIHSFSTTPASDGYIDVSLGDLSATTGGTATVTLNGTVDNTAGSRAVAMSKFIGSNAITTAATPSFNVTKSALTLSLDANSQTQAINAGATSGAKVTGTIGLPATDTANADVTLHATWDGNDYELPDAEAHPTGSGTTRTFSLTVPGNKLTTTPNPHQLALYATDGTENSATATATVTIGQIKLGDTSSQLTFTPTFLTGSDQTVKRDSDWSLDVDDTLTKGSTWTLSAQTAGLYRDDVDAPGNKLSGALVYKSTPVAKPQTLGTTPVAVDTGRSDGAAETTDVASDWSGDTGLLLDVDGGATQGTYSGEILWTLTSAP